MKALILKFLLIIPVLCEGQAHVKSRKFVDWHKIDDSTDKVRYPDHDFTQTYLNDSTFLLSGFFGTGSAKDLTLSFNKEGYWFLKKGNGWESFFAFNDTVLTQLRLDWGYAFTLKWSYKATEDCGPVYTLHLVPPKNISISHLPTYYFTPTMGFVGIYGNAAFLVEKDNPCNLSPYKYW